MDEPITVARRLEKISLSARSTGYIAALADVVEWCTAQLQHNEHTLVDSQELVPFLEKLREDVDVRVRGI